MRQVQHEWVASKKYPGRVLLQSCGVWKEICTTSYALCYLLILIFSGGLSPTVNRLLLSLQFPKYPKPSM